MDLYKRPGSPFWWVDYSVGGQRRRVSTKRRNKKEATAVASELVRKDLDSTQLGRRTATFFDVAQEYSDHLSQRSKSAGSIKGARYMMEVVAGRVRRMPGLPPTLQLHEIEPTHLMRLRRDMEIAGYAPSSVRKHMLYVRTILRYGAQMGYSTSDARPQLPKVQRKLRYLMNGEEARLLEAVDPAQRDLPPQVRSCAHIMAMVQEVHDLTIFLLDTGCRFQEAAKVSWLAIDTTDWETLNLYRQKFGVHGALTITNRLREVLQRRRAQSPRSMYVFQGRGDGKEARQSHSNALYRAITRAGLNADPMIVNHYGRFTPHSLRHTFATRLVRAGMSLRKIQALLGHDSIQSTEIYAHLDPGYASAEAADILNRLATGA